MEPADPANTDLLRRLGAALAAQRHAQGLTQAALAEQLGISDKAIARWESGARDMRVSTLVRLAAALEVGVQALIAGADPAPARQRTARKTGPRQGLAQAGWKSVSKATPGAVAIYDLQAHAGRARAKPAPSVAGWALPKHGHPREEGLFIAQVHGTSMQPKYRDGQWLLFATLKEPAPRIGSDVLVRVASEGELYGWVVKRVSALREDAAGRTELTLQSYNPQFADQTAILAPSGDAVVLATVKAAL